MRPLKFQSLMVAGLAAPGAVSGTNYREIVKALCTGSDAVDSAPLFQELKKEVEKLFG